METLRVGVVGIGAMGQLFARLLTELPNARLCGVADLLVERAKTITHASILSLLTFDDGTIATLETCWAAPMPSWQFEAVGTDGMIHITSPEIGSTFYSVDGVQSVNPLYSSEPVVEGQTLNVYQAELMHFLGCVAQDRPFVIQPQEALVAVAVAEAIDRSVLSGQPEIPAEVIHE